MDFTNLQIMGFSGGLVDKESTCNAGDSGDAVLIPTLGRSLGEGKATHSSTMAWKILWTEEPVRIQSKGYKESDTTEQLSMQKHKSLKNDSFKNITESRKQHISINCLGHLYSAFPLHFLLQLCISDS